MHIVYSDGKGRLTQPTAQTLIHICGFARSSIPRFRWAIPNQPRHLASFFLSLVSAAGNFLFCTPGRLHELMLHSEKLILRTLEFLVLDEGAGVFFSWTTPPRGQGIK